MPDPTYVDFMEVDSVSKEFNPPALQGRLKVRGDEFENTVTELAHSATEHGDVPAFQIVQSCGGRGTNNKPYITKYETVLHFQTGVPSKVGFNGPTPEAYLLAVAMRLCSFQNKTPFACSENEKAINHIYAAIDALTERTARRIAEKTEGKYEEKEGA